LLRVNSEIFTMIYTTLAVMLNISIFLYGEQRVDAYIALNILCFYITYSIARPARSIGLALKILHIALLSLFAAIVGYRVYEVLT